MTDEQFEALTRPTHFTNEAPLILGVGLSVSGASDPERKHHCGACMNPFTGGREDCRNNKEARHV